MKQCPAERFCSLPGGEMCIYGVADVPTMTQIKAADLAPVVCPVNTAGLPEVGGFAMLLAMGVLFGAFWRRRK